jgi:hypothetical protein
MIEGQEVTTQLLGMNLVRDYRDKELAKYDWYAIREISAGVAIPENVKVYTQALRDLPNNCIPILDEAGNLTNSIDIFPILEDN